VLSVKLKKQKTEGKPKTLKAAIRSSPHLPIYPSTHLLIHLMSQESGGKKQKIEDRRKKSLNPKFEALVDSPGKKHFKP